ncbi:MAG: hypothetical protein IJL12_03660 [Selenomonadaceae bacterium]|nr:hypothetical protein [Selenomonadaceae bacterium]
MNDYAKDFLELLNSVNAKRPRTVIRHILEHGFITNILPEDMKNNFIDFYG